jgi:hypothetical protein
MGTPFSSILVAAECRKSWNRSPAKGLMIPRIFALESEFRQESVGGCSRLHFGHSTADVALCQGTYYAHIAGHAINS